MEGRGGPAAPWQYRRSRPRRRTQIVHSSDARRPVQDLGGGRAGSRGPAAAGARAVARPLGGLRVAREGQLGQLDRPPVELAGLAVQRVEVVVRARLGLEDVDDHVAVVEQDPPAQLDALGARVLLPGRLEPRVQLVVDRPDLGAAVGGDEDEVVGELQLVGDVEDADLPGLLGVGEVGRRGGQLPGFDLGSPGFVVLAAGRETSARGCAPPGGSSVSRSPRTRKGGRGRAARAPPPGRERPGRGARAVEAPRGSGGVSGFRGR